MLTTLMRRYLPLLALAALSFTIYGQTLGHDFLVNWDDPGYITDNPDIVGFSMEHLRHAFTRFYLGNYAPLHLISYMVDYTFWGLNPTGFALTNVILHTANGLLAYLILLRLTRRPGPAFFAAAIFLLHPVQVESVAWLSQRKSVLAMFFFLLALLAYRFYRERRGNPLPLYLLSLVFFLFALLAKSTAVILPAVLVAYDVFFAGEKGARRLIVDKIPFVLLSTAFSVLAVYSEAGGGRSGYLGAKAGVQLLNMLPVFGRYLSLLAWPTGLNVIYNTPIKTAVDLDVVGGGLILGLFLAGCTYFAFKRRELFFWAVVFIVGLLPVANIIPQITLMNDRYLYFPMLGFAPLLTYGVWPVLEPPGRKRLVLRTAGLLVLLFWAIMGWQRVAVWRDAVTLWRDAVAKAPAGAWYGFDRDFLPGALAEALARKGIELQEKGNLDAAIGYYREALSYDPLEHHALYNLGAICLMQGRVDEALVHAEKLGENFVHHDRGYLLLGTIYNMKGQLDLAEEKVKKALEINPANEQATFMLKSIQIRRSMRPGGQKQ